MITEFDLSQYTYPMDEVFGGVDFEELTPVEIEDQDRWSTFYSQVLQHQETGHFWLAQWARGSTEQQDVEPNLSLTLVEPVQVMRTEYRIVTS